MRWQDRVEEYIKSVCKEIRNKDAHERISGELRNHIADFRDYYMAQTTPRKLLHMRKILNL